MLVFILVSLQDGDTRWLFCNRHCERLSARGCRRSNFLKYTSGFSDKLKTAALLAAPTARLRPTDEKTKALSVGLNLFVGDKKV
jgi:hypothetical protein